MEIVKNQHYIPQLVQKEFSENEREVFAINEFFLENKIKYLLKINSIKNTMSQKHCYELPDNLLNIDTLNYLEKKFSNYENDYKKYLDIVKEMLERRNSFYEIKKYIEDNMLISMIIFYFRAASRVLLFNNFNNKKLSYEEENLRRKKVFERIYYFVSNKDFLTKFKKTIINNYNLHILLSKDNGFLLSDNYMSTASIDYKGNCINEPFFLNRTIGLTNIVILIPISSKYYLLYTDDTKINCNEHYIHVYKKYNNYYNNINYYNSIIYRNSCYCTIGRNIKSLRYVFNNVKKYSLYSYTYNYIQKPEIWCDEEIDKKFYSLNIKLKSQKFYVYEGSMCEPNIFNDNSYRSGMDFRIVNVFDCEREYIDKTINRY